MNWEKLDLHLENLIPGVVLLSILEVVLRPDLGPLADRDAVLAVAFIATAYMFGTVGNVLARMLLDYVSRKTIRAFVFRTFLEERLPAGLTAKAINKRYSEVITAGLTCGNPRIEAEVAKRRQTCRLLRSTLIPAWLVLFATGRHLNWGALSTTLAIIATYCTFLALYAYAETTIYQEGYRGEQIKKAEKPTTG